MVFDDILFSTIEFNVASYDIDKRWWIFQVPSLMFLSFWLYCCQIIWWKSRLLICLARYSVFLHIFCYRISFCGSSVCSVIVLPHTSLWIPQSFSRISLNEQIPVAFMKQNCVLFIYLLLFIWQSCRRVRLCRVDWWDDVWTLNLKVHMRYRPWHN
jgi:hypothetical protein